MSAVTAGTPQGSVTSGGAGSSGIGASRVGRLPVVRITLRQLRAPLAVLALLVLGSCVQLVLHYRWWDDAVALRDQVGSYAYHFQDYLDGAQSRTPDLLADARTVAFRPALYAAALVGALTAREWESRRVALVLAQSVAPRRWFGARWATLAAVFAVLTVPLAVAYQVGAAHAFRLDLLVHGAYRQSAYFTVGPVTVAYVLLGAAAGAYAGTRLRRTLPALLAAPALTWLIVAVLVRSRAVLLVDFPLFGKVDGFHAGGLLGLQFFDTLPQDSFLVNSLDPGDYWGFQLASSALALAAAALLAVAAFRALRRTTA